MKPGFIKIAPASSISYTNIMNPSGDNQEFQYQQGNGQMSSPSSLSDTSPAQKLEDTAMVQWRASEFIDHQKSPTWFLQLSVGAILVSGLMYLITRDIFSSVVVFLAFAALGFFAKQKPRTLTYSLLPTTVKIGERSYSYDDFRTFSVVQDGALFSILLQPLKRFMPPLTIYFDPQDGERIFDALAAHIPHEERAQDPIDRFMRKIRF